MTDLRVDLHTHTHYSPDALTAPTAFIDACLARGVNCVAVTDHNTIRGAVAMRDAFPLKIIVGEEIRTLDGEIIGLFLKEDVPPRLSADQTVKLIKEQGGLVSIPHPFDRLRRKSLSEEAALRVADSIDIFETFNARVTFSRDNQRAQRFAQDHNLLIAAVTDAHTPGELGRSYVEVPDFDGPDEFLKSLKRARLVTHTASPFVHAMSYWARLRRRVFGWKPV
jgi:predicted metal-dependent phosphoesterase TrpH